MQRCPRVKQGQQKRPQRWDGGNCSSKCDVRCFAGHAPATRKEASTTLSEMGGRCNSMCRRCEGPAKHRQSSKQIKACKELETGAGAGAQEKPLRCRCACCTRGSGGQRDCARFSGTCQSPGCHFTWRDRWKASRPSLAESSKHVSAERQRLN